MSGDKQQTAVVELTVPEMRGLRMAVIFGVPVPTPRELESATQKLREAEARLAAAERTNQQTEE